MGSSCSNNQFQVIPLEIIEHVIFPFVGYTQLRDINRKYYKKFLEELKNDGRRADMIFIRMFARDYYDNDSFHYSHTMIHRELFEVIVPESLLYMTRKMFAFNSRDNVKINDILREYVLMIIPKVQRLIDNNCRKSIYSVIQFVEMIWHMFRKKVGPVDNAILSMPLACVDYILHKDLDLPGQKNDSGIIIVSLYQ